MPETLLVSLSSAGGVIVGALLASIALYWSAVTNLRSAIILCVISVLAFLTLDDLVIGPIAAVPLTGLNAAVAHAITTWSNGLGKVTVLVLLSPFLRVVTLLPLETMKPTESLQRWLTFRLGDPDLATKWMHHIWTGILATSFALVYVVILWITGIGK